MKKKKNFILIGFIFLVLFIIIICIAKFTKSNDSSEIIDTKTTEASIIACGDIMAHGPQLRAQYNQSTDNYSFINNYKYVKEYIQSADFSIANLETTLCKNDIYPYSSYPQFNTPDELADALKEAGFDLLSTINNHSFDKSSLGVERTLSTLKEKGFLTLGTRQEESEDDYIIQDVNNIKLGITAYSYGEIKNGQKYLNGIKISDDKKNLMNIFDYSNVDNAFNTINSTVKKLEGTDMQIVIIHWGNEYQRTPNNFQKELAQKLCDAGVDIIIGSHPHVVQPVETIKSSDGNHETTVIYSLGNYISNQRREILNKYTEDGLMVNIDIEKKNSDDEATVKKVTCIPTWVSKYHDSSIQKYVYEIIPICGNILNQTKYIDSNYLLHSYKQTSELIKTDDKIEVIKSPFKNL